MTKKFLFLFASLLFYAHLSAQSCLGYWITIDDESGLKKSVVELYKKDEKMYGKVVYIYKRGKDGPHTLCELCCYEEALKHFDKAIALNPNYAEAWCNKGHAHN